MSDDTAAVESSTADLAIDVSAAEPTTTAVPVQPTTTAGAAESSTAESVVETPVESKLPGSSTAEPVIVESAETHTADSLIDDFELIEPVASDTTDNIEAESRDADQASVDEFEAAARLFSFTGETSVQSPAAEQPQSVAEDPAPEPVAHVAKDRKARTAPARACRASLKRTAAASFSVGVMAIIGILTVGLTTPAEAVAAGASLTASPPAGDVDADAGEIQAYVAPAQVQNVALARSENYSAGTLVDLAGTVGISNFSSSVFTNDPNCSIQWPFAVGVEMTWGFGMRSGRMHEGIDFTPGTGAHIQAIADGVVRVSTDSSGAFGASIVIDHIVDGRLVSSRYAHLQYGSRQVQVGDTVSVGEYVGRTGNTGRSFGAHTHLEILQNGADAIDPLPWLRSHATC